MAEKRREPHSIQSSADHPEDIEETQLAETRPTKELTADGMIPSNFGNYRVVKVLGQGGMGIQSSDFQSVHGGWAKSELEAVGPQPS